MKEAVQELRSLIINKQEWEPVWNRLAKKYIEDPEIIRPLVLMLDWEKDVDFEDFSWEVLHFIENFSDRVYVTHLLKVAVDLSKSSDYFLRRLLNRVVNSDNCRKLLEQECKKSDDATQSCIITTLRSIRNKIEKDEAERIDKYDQLLKTLET